MVWWIASVVIWIVFAIAAYKGMRHLQYKNMYGAVELRLEVSPIR